MIGAPAFERGAVDAFDAEAAGDVVGFGFGPGEGASRDVREALVLAVIAGEAREMPAHGAVAQRHHLVGHAGIDQRLRADDAAGAAGAIDHDQRVGRGRDVVHAQHQFGARHVDAGRDRDARIFVVRPAVEHHHVGAGAHQRVELVGADAGRAAGVLDEFAERLARHVHAGEQLEAGGGPGGVAAVEIGEIAVAGAGEDIGGARAEAVIVVDQHDARGAARHQRGEAQFEPAQRHVARPQQMAAREDQFLAHIDQRQFAAVAEHGLDGGGGDGMKHCFRRVQVHDACCAYICSTAPVFRSILMRLILSRLVPVTRMKRA